MEKKLITVETTIDASLEKVWHYFNTPVHVQNWNNASADWHTPFAENDLREGGTFCYRMAARNGRKSFDFTGVYTKVEEMKEIRYRLDDNREVCIFFAREENGTRLTEKFEPENEYPLQVQKDGWQAILDNFKMYVEDDPESGNTSTKAAATTATGVTLNPYLNFNGNTEEAFNFYRSVFGGEFLVLQRFRDTPEAEKLPESEQNKIMHVALPVGSNILMATDVVESFGQQVTSGTNSYLSLHPDSEKEARRLFRELSKGGEVEMEMQEMFWGALYGSFTDKFGIKWMVNFDLEKK